jgi:hypothetical protein
MYLKNVFKLFISIFLVWNNFLLADKETSVDQRFTPNFLPELSLHKVNQPINIDGELDDAGWKTASVARNFSEFYPGDQTEPAVNTEVLLTYDSNNFYFAFICYDDPAKVRASYIDRDRMRGNDAVEILLDTYGEAAWGYELMANPYGIQADWLWSRAAGENGADITYDLIWESAGKITDSGYQVEIAIPFSSLRFPNRQEQSWRIDLRRIRPRESFNQYSWAAQNRDEPCNACEWGTISGIKDVKPSKGVEILPSLIAYQSGALSEIQNPDSPFENRNPELELSLNGKFSLTSDMTAEATVNPDFSQVEADAEQIDVNTTLALFYPERRPFFQEGSDLFRTWIPIFYSRSINNPQIAGKLVTRKNRNSMGYLFAGDQNSAIILPFEESSAILLGGKSSNNILRYQRAFGIDSHIGFLLTDRRLAGGGSGTLLNIDSQLRLHRNIRIQSQLVGSYTVEPDDQELSGQISQLIENGLIDSTFNNEKYTAIFDGESYPGHGIIVNLEERSRHFNFDATYWEYSPTFRADNGFQTNNNYRQTEMLANYTFYFRNSFVERIRPITHFGRRWNFDKVKKVDWLELGVETNLKGQTTIISSYRKARERFRGELFTDLWRFHMSLSSYFSESLGITFSTDYGNEIVRLYAPPVLGRQTDIELGARIKPINRIRIEPTFSFSKSASILSENSYFQGFIARTSLYFQFNRMLSFRLVAQFNDFYQTWNFDPLIIYRMNPFSVFYVGSTYDYCRFSSGERGTQTQMISRQVFIKLQYLFQI